MKIFITGIAGTLGSALTGLFLEKGFEVKGNDIVRIDEAWKIHKVKNQIEYLWKSSLDLYESDLGGADMIFDCGLAFADRPLGNANPTHTLIGNLMPPVRILEIVRRMKKKPIVVYPSSFNTLYGYPSGTVFTEKMMPFPSSQYGWSKAAAELLYLTYCKAYKLPIIVCRVGSAYGQRMRTDELVGKLIIYSLQGRDFYLRSPLAKRLWTYAKDVLFFYDKLVSSPEQFIGKILLCAGNVGDRIITNLELAKIITGLTKSSIKITEGEYESGEMIDGKPINFLIDASYTRESLDWNPKYTIEEGLKETIEWFDKEWKK